jgi:hypothetical protein
MNFFVTLFNLPGTGTWYSNGFMDLIYLFTLFVYLPFAIRTVWSIGKIYYQIEYEKELQRRGKV